MSRRIFGFFCLLFTWTISPAPANAQQNCQALASLKLPDTTITIAQPVAAGDFKPASTNPGGPPAGALPGAGPDGRGRGGAPQGTNGGRGASPFANLAAFCRVAAEIKPTNDSDIKIEVWMPSSGWNGKLQATGNGGWSGAIGFPAMAQALARGYATTGTDTGHEGGSGSFALGHPEKLVDFGYRAVHLMTVQAKAIIAAYYGRGPRLSYWVACSTGGRQGLREAQQFPTDYDGIVAGAPANYMTHLEAWTLWGPAAMNATPESPIPPAKFPAIHQAVLAACDTLDGVKDGLLEDPRACHFEPKTLLCKGEDANNCLTAAQVQTAEKIYAPATNPRTKEIIYPAFQPGSELGWTFFAGPSAPSVATDLFKYETFKDANWDWHTFNFDSDMALADKVDGGVLNTHNPDLSPFFKRGGKLIQYHGWSDTLIAPENSINYYSSVAAKLGGAEKIDQSYRFFMVPGMGHCAGGEGPTNFDMLTAMEEWREQSKAPERVVTSKYVEGDATKGVTMARPLCPYPGTAEYTGSGDTNDATNFACVVPAARSKN